MIMIIYIYIVFEHLIHRFDTFRLVFSKLHLNI